MTRKILSILAPLALLSACATTGQEDVIIREVPIEVKVPVIVPCVGNKPEAVVPLRDQVSRQEWSMMNTSQREALLAIQAENRKLYGEQLDDATIGCK